MKERIQAYRELNFQKNILMEKQPASVIGLNLFRSWKLSNRTENSTVVKCRTLYVYNSHNKSIEFGKLRTERYLNTN
jgi:hypothetical protein